jgi:glycerophosphoryl diester phosphodiesterase
MLPRSAPVALAIVGTRSTSPAAPRRGSEGAAGGGCVAINRRIRYVALHADDHLAMKRRLIGFMLLALAAPASAVDLQGHRGARGLAPENTLAAFRIALAIGVSTLETDLALTADDVLVLSHDPMVKAALARTPDGRWLDADGPPIRALTAAEVARYDVGRLDPSHPYARSFPQQIPADGEPIPTLAQLFALARDAKSPGGRPVRFNVETKVTPDQAQATASPQQFAEALARALDAAGMADRVTVESFDWRSLVALKRLRPSVKTVCLTIDSDGMNTVRADATGASPWHAGLRRADYGGSLVRTVQAAGCGAWSPFWRNVTAAAVAEAHALGLAVVPWTVNMPADIERMLEFGVDGLITDYPDRAHSVFAAHGITVD